eukprot:TRINITY_DN4890_c0_g1_i2.p1 TRINITY_DN4890_c0_g1~~TRINITY_DN4890_c0_g1_i2.p1  ORF type:complete len:290 (-),score=79.19 TRINITY_DN4890_c0_g1_i2:225-1094(-)
MNIFAKKEGAVSKKALKVISDAQKREESTIDLNNQKLKEWPMSLFQLRGLKKLTISKNFLTTAHPQLSTFKEHLRHIDLSKNEITDIDPSFCELVNLKFLHLSHNKITTLPSSFKKLVSLEEVYLDNNNIEFLDPVFESKHLVVLDFSFNKIVRLSTELCVQLSTTKLETWYLNDNKLTRVPIEVCSFASLKKLDISNNGISLLPKKLAERANSFSTFKLDGNPWQDPPRQICAGGPQAIVAYFKERDDKEVAEKMAGKHFLSFLSLCDKHTHTNNQQQTNKQTINSTR